MSFSRVLPYHPFHPTLHFLCPPPIVLFWMLKKNRRKELEHFYMTVPRLQLCFTLAYIFAFFRMLYNPLTLRSAPLRTLSLSSDPAVCFNFFGPSFIPGCPIFSFVKWAGFRWQHCKTPFQPRPPKLHFNWIVSVLHWKMCHKMLAR